MTVAEGSEKLYPGVTERREHQGGGKGNRKRGQGHAWEQGTVERCEHGTELEQSCRRSESELGDKVGTTTRGAGVLAFLPPLVPVQRRN